MTLGGGGGPVLGISSARRVSPYTSPIPALIDDMDVLTFPVIEEEA